MDSIIKKLFSGLRSSKNVKVPEEFLWDNMKEGILEKMAKDDEPTAIITGNGRSAIVKRGLLLLLLLLTGAVILNYDSLVNFGGKKLALSIKTNKTGNNYTSPSNTSIEKELIKNSESDIQDNPDNINNEDVKTSVANNENINSTKNGSLNKTVNTSPGQENVFVKTGKKSSSGLNSEPTDRKVVIDKSDRNTSANKLNQNENIVTENDFVKDNSISIANNEAKTINVINPDTNNQNEIFNNSLIIKTQKELQLIPVKSSGGIKINSLQLNEKSINHKLQNLVYKWSVGFITGAGMMPVAFNKYNSNSIVARETGLISPYAKLYVKRSFKNNFNISVGGEYQNIRSYLDYRKDTLIKVELKDIVLSTVHNLITDEVTYERGDTIVDAVFSHNVKHVNSTVALQIPVTIGYNFTSGRLSTGVSAGAVFNVMSTHTGKTYNKSGQILDLGASDQNQTHNVGVSLLASLNVSYKIASRYNILAEAGYQKYLKDWRRGVSSSGIPGLMRIGVGVEYRF